MKKTITCFIKGNKLILLLILQPAVFLFVACSDDNITNDNPGIPVITGISPQPAYIGDIVTIYGKGLGALSDSSYVYVNNMKKLSYDCISWDNGEIKFELPFGVSSGKIWIETKKGKSNEFSFLLGAFPPIEMVSVLAGEFNMGSDIGFDDEKPVHKVVLTKGFDISKYEILRTVWHAVVYPDSGTFIYRDLPANNMSWISAVKFCNRISVLSGLDSCYIFNGGQVIWDKTADGYRMPTEAEWEYACRAGTEGDFGGSGIPGEMAWYNGNSGLRCMPPGLKKPNAFGIYDMHGNLWEWCWDIYSKDYYTASPAADPSGPTEGAARVLRGGSFVDGTLYLRSSNRATDLNENTFTGIRVVRTKFE